METVKKLIAAEKTLAERKENDPNAAQNAVYYATKERDIYRLLNDQFSQMVADKMSETQALQSQLFKVQRTSRELVQDAQTKWATQSG